MRFMIPQFHERSITIKAIANAKKIQNAKFGDYIESRRVICYKMTFFKMFKLNDSRLQNKIFDKQLDDFKL